MSRGDRQTVRATPLCSAMAHEVAQSLIGNQLVCTHEKRAVLVQQGEPAHAFFVVLDGWVKLFRITRGGGEAVVGVFRRGETFAEAAIFLERRYQVSAEVVTAGRLLSVDGGMLRNCIR